MLRNKVNMLGEAAEDLSRERVTTKDLSEKLSIAKLRIETIQKQLDRKVKDCDELEVQLETSKTDGNQFK